MHDPLLLAGLGVSLGGALVVGLADALLSRLTLVYLDAIEANVAKLVEAVRTGANQLTVTDVDVKRDRRQNRLRACKTLGWLTLALGLGLQLTAYLIRVPF